MVKLRVVLTMWPMLCLPLGAADVSGEWNVRGAFDSASVACTLNDTGTSMKVTFSIANMRGEFTAEKP